MLLFGCSLIKSVALETVHKISYTIIRLIVLISNLFVVFFSYIYIYMLIKVLAIFEFVSHQLLCCSWFLMNVNVTCNRWISTVVPKCKQEKCAIRECILCSCMNDDYVWLMVTFDYIIHSIPMMMNVCVCQIQSTSLSQNTLMLLLLCRFIHQFHWRADRSVSIRHSRTKPCKKQIIRTHTKHKSENFTSRSLSHHHILHTFAIAMLRFKLSQELRLFAYVGRICRPISSMIDNSWAYLDIPFAFMFAFVGCDCDNVWLPPLYE